MADYDDEEQQQCIDLSYDQPQSSSELAPVAAAIEPAERTEPPEQAAWTGQMYNHYSGSGGAGGASSTGPVDVCHRDAEGIPLQSTFDWQHYWLRTPDREGGVHPQPGGSPGYSGGLLSDTAIDVHTGAGNSPGSTCDPVEEYAGVHVDPVCVDQELQPGRPTGKWFPKFNDCQSEVDRIIEKCRREKSPIEDGAGYE